jgi:uncharacterized protein YjbI with pentapeptide repeats
VAGTVLAGIALVASSGRVLVNASRINASRTALVLTGRTTLVLGSGAVQVSDLSSRLTGADRVLSGWRLVALMLSRRTGVTLTGVTLTGVTLTRLALTRLALTRLALTRLALTRLALSGGILTRLTLTRLTLTDLTLPELALTRVSLADLELASLALPQLTHSWLTGDALGSSCCRGR